MSKRMQKVLCSVIDEDQTGYIKGRFIGQNIRFVSDIIENNKYNKSTLDNSPPPNYDKESKDECHHVNNNPRYKWYVK